MAVAINMPTQRVEQKESDLDKIAKILGIGANAYGIYDSVKQAPQREALAKAAQLDVDKKTAEDAMRRRWESGNITEGDQLAMNDKYIFTDDPNKYKGARQINVERAPGTFDPSQPVTPMQRWVISRADHDSALSESIKNAELRKINAETNKLYAEASKKGMGREIPASDALLIGGADSAFKALDDMNAVFAANPDITGPGTGHASKVKGWLEWGQEGTRAKTFDAQAQANAQIIGKFLEGGKLAEGDIKRYRNMLPGLTDSPDAAKAKIEILQNLIAQKQQAELAALKNSGFNTGALSAQRTQQNPNLLPVGAPTVQNVRISVPKELQGLTPQQQIDLVTRKIIEKQGITSTLPQRRPGT